MKADRPVKGSDDVAYRRSTEAEGQELISAWQESGLSVAQFCRNRGLPAHRVHYWKRRIADSSSPHAGEVPEFFSIDVASEAAELSKADRRVSPIVIWAGTSVRIELPANASRDQFVRTIGCAVEAMQR